MGPGVLGSWKKGRGRGPMHGCFQASCLAGPCYPNVQGPFKLDGAPFRCPATPRAPLKGPLQSLKGPGGTSAVAEWFCNMRLQRQTCKCSRQTAFHKARMKPPSEHDMLLGLLASLLVSGSNTSRFLGQIWFIRRALQAPEDTGWASAEPRATLKHRKGILSWRPTTNSQSRIRKI